MFEKLKEKGSRLLLVPTVAMAGAPAWAGDLSAAVTEAKGKIESSVPDAVTMLGAMLAVGVVVWIGIKLVGLVRK